MSASLGSKKRPMKALEKDVKLYCYWLPGMRHEQKGRRGKQNPTVILRQMTRVLDSKIKSYHLWFVMLSLFNLAEMSLR